MKKIILFLFLFVGIISAQTSWTKYDKQEGRFTKHAKGDSSAINVYMLNASGDTLGTVSIILSQAQIDSLQKAVQEGVWNINNISGIISLPTGAATSANQTTQIAKEDSLVDMTTASATSLAIMDDWDEIDRAKVNPIVGQAGVAANRGTAGVTTQRVTIANDDTTSTLQTAIKTSVQLLDNAVDGNYLNANVNFAGVDATVNIGNADATTQRVVLASDQPTVPINYVGSSNSYASWATTAGTNPDSVTFGFTTRSVTFINDGTASDTLYVSSSILFPATNTVKRIGGEGFTKQWASAKLYYKIGATPLASKKVRIEGN